MTPAPVMELRLVGRLNVPSAFKMRTLDSDEAGIVDRLEREPSGFRMAACCETEECVSAAAAKSLVKIAQADLQEKGRVARILVSSLERVGPRERQRILGALTELANRNMGDEVEPWLEWAYDMP